MKGEYWHAWPIEKTAHHLHTNAVSGLSESEAARRLLLGKNRLPEPPRAILFSRVLRQFASPIALVLLGAAFGTVFISHYSDALVIFAALLVNVIIGVIQEGRASRAFDALRSGEAKRATVVREGMTREIPAEEVVEGDFAILPMGGVIPADVRLIEIHGLLVNEAALSGEWVPVSKTTGEVSEHTALSERTSMGYAGTLVVGGVGRGIVVAIGGITEIGGIAASIRTGTEPETPLARDIRSIARLIIGIAAVILLLIILLAIVRGIPFSEALFMAVALAVASVPEGLPAAVTVVLALGMERVLRKGGLVRSLLAAETLGTTSIILTDKTGTLTEGRMKAVGFATLSGTTELEGGEAAKRMLRAAVLASDAYTEEAGAPSPGEEKIVARGRPVEQAIVLAGLEAGISERELRAAHPRLDELHFSSARRFGGMLVEEGGRSVAYLAGAPELFMEHAHHAHGSQGVTLFTPERARFFTDSLTRAAREGKRVIAVGRAPLKERSFPPEHELVRVLSHLELFGFIILSDAIRPEARQAIADMQSAGARVLMLTGDNPETALFIAREVGIAGTHDRTHTGAELDSLSDDELYETLMMHPVFARVSPSQKLRIARVFKNRGEVVAMTGDGVNDAPALSEASIGIALGSGTDVAKEASDLVLLNDSFSVITDAIREGRRLRDNFKKIFTYMLSTNFSETFIISFALLFALPLPVLPTQILWANLIEGGLMNFAFASEPLSSSAMKRRPDHPDVRTVVSREVVKLIILVGFITGLFLMGVYVFLLSRGLPEEEIRTIVFAALSIEAVFSAVALKSFGTPLWKLPIFSNPFLLISIAASLFMLGVALFVPPVQKLVHTTPLSFSELGFLLCIGLVNLATIEVAKWLIFIRPSARREREAARGV